MGSLIAVWLDFASQICFLYLDYSPMEPVEEKIGPHLWKEELKMAQETGDVILFGRDSSSRLDICFSRCQRTAKQSFNSYTSCIWLYIDSLVIYT